MFKKDYYRNCDINEEVIVLPNESGKRPAGFYTTTNLIKIRQSFKTNIKKFIDNLKPFLIPKYWPIYLLSFGLGLYLLGPSHGLQKIYQWKLQVEQQRDKNFSVVTLRHELSRLKQQLQIEQSKRIEPPFDPHSFSRPALGPVVQGFEWTGFHKSWRLHPGVDISMPPGSNVMAAAAGTILKIEKIVGGNYTVTIDHGNGWESVYSNLADIQVQDGQKLIKGVIIGATGPAGIQSKMPGFQFGIYHDQQPVDPKNIIEGL